MTLTETATATKRFLRVFLIFSAGFLVIWITFLIVYNNVIVPYQKSQIKPEKRFATLPQPKFPPTLLTSSSLTYSLNTTSGALPPDTSKLINVYFLPPQATTLLAPDKARQLAAGLGFKNGPDILSPTQYRFTDGSTGTMLIDLSNSNFSFTRTGSPQPDSQLDPILPPDDQIITNFKDYLDQNGLLPKELDSDSAKVIYDQGDNKDSTTAIVSLWPTEIDKLPIVTGNPDQALIHATVTKYQNSLLRYTSLDYTYWPVDLQTFSTYSLKPVAQAYKELQSGQGIVVKNNTQGSNASITKVYLAYFMSKDYLSFLEPVYVFESDQFTAYVLALTPDSYGQ